MCFKAQASATYKGQNLFSAWLQADHASEFAIYPLCRDMSFHSQALWDVPFSEVIRTPLLILSWELSTFWLVWHNYLPTFKELTCPLTPPCIVFLAWVAHWHPRTMSWWHESNNIVVNYSFRCRYVDAQSKKIENLQHSSLKKVLQGWETWIHQRLVLMKGGHLILKHQHLIRAGMAWSPCWGQERQEMMTWLPLPHLEEDPVLNIGRYQTCCCFLPTICLDQAATLFADTLAIAVILIPFRFQANLHNCKIISNLPHKSNVK